MEHYIAALKKYATFTGRDRRKQFWYFVLFNFLISFVLGIIDGVINLGGDGGIGILCQQGLSFVLTMPLFRCLWFLSKQELEWSMMLHFLTLSSLRSPLSLSL